MKGTERMSRSMRTEGWKKMRSIEKKDNEEEEKEEEEKWEKSEGGEIEKGKERKEN